MSQTSIDYRTRFKQPSDAAQYDEKVYKLGTVHDLLWQVEQPQVDQLIRDLRADLGHIDYLDFACGTGRVLSHVENLVDSATGIDISSAMLGLAKNKVKSAQLHCKDITQQQNVEGRYDLITAFRFLTNAEPSLRRDVLQGLARRLRDSNSVLIINIHANPWSYKAPFVPYHWLKHHLGRALPQQNLTRRQVIRELGEAGFRVEKVIGVGFVSEKFLQFAPFSFWLSLERQLAGKAFVQRFGVNQMFVCRLASAGSASHEPIAA